MKELSRIWILMARKLSGEAMPEEIAELERFQQQHPELTYSLQMTADLWKSQHPAEETAAEADQAFSRHLTRMALRDIQSTEPGPEAVSPPIRREKFNLAQTRDLVANYLTTTVRSLRRNKGFTTINISGLAIGLASAIVLLLWIRNEVSFEQFHTNRDRVYLAMTRAPLDGQLDVDNHTPMVMASQLKTHYSKQIEEAVRINWVGAFILSNADKHIQTQGYLCDPGFFRLFTFPLLRGNPATALSTPRSVVLTERLAKRLFGDSDALGRTLSVDSTDNFVVSAVVKNQPSNTQFQFDYLIPWSYTKEVHWEETLWQKPTILTYVLLRPGVTEDAANKAMRMVIHDHAQEIPAELFFHPMRKWHLYSNFIDGKAAGGGINFVRMLAVIAGFILLIACINYMNLSTARSIRHAREVGIRKVIGSGRASLIGRFLGESLLLSLVAGALALSIVVIALPWFDHLVGTDLTIPYGNPWFWLGGLGFIVFTGLLAGSYPAFYLSAFRPVNILRGHFKTIHSRNFVGAASARSFLVRNLRYSSVTPRRILVVFQFAFAITFIICTIVIYREFDYALNRKSGYDMNGLAFVFVKGDIAKNYPAIREELLATHAVSTLTRTDAPISEIWSWNDNYTWPGKDPTERTVFIQYHTDRAFTGTMGLKLIEGRDIDVERYPQDTAAVLLSKEAVQRMGFANPVGQTIKDHSHTWHVVGVINDFVTGNVFNRTYPTIIQGTPPRILYGTLTFRFDDQQNRAESEAKLTAILRKYNPNYPLEFFYVDKYLLAKAQGDEHFGTLAALFAGMAIFISCLGLFGLSAYMAESRLKEVGVRKVLGASIMRITALLSKDFLVLVVIAFIIASPIAWWFMRQWLAGIPYHIGMNWWIFALTGVLSVIIAIGSVGYQAVRAALTNPVLILRTD
ncbi:ABC transporter permease [Puia sp.]|jgi:ABC-type antimicrobial peptide transport system permease subunit|uniref:ABC transporter permease n=1 Tax=Puia sp. TaxID=2045100 RepID=UPI002F3FB38C